MYFGWSVAGGRSVGHGPSGSTPWPSVTLDLNSPLLHHFKLLSKLWRFDSDVLAQ